MGYNIRGLKIMSKTASFNDSEKDKALVKRIEKYQKDKKHKHFIDAVRELCETGLDIEMIKRK